MTIYRQIPGFIDHRVGDDGTIWSRRPRNGKGPIGPWRELKPFSIGPSGHLRVDLHYGESLPSRIHYVHRLVLEAFVGPCPSGMEARHFPDRNPANNRLSNLQWSTHKENSADRAFHKTELIGEANGMAKLSAADVKSIREQLVKGTLQKIIAKAYGVRQSTISKIKLGLRWKHAV